LRKLIGTPAICPHCPELVHLEDLFVQTDAILNIEYFSTESDSNHDRDDGHNGSCHDDQYDSDRPVENAFSYSRVEALC